MKLAYIFTAVALLASPAVATDGRTQMELAAKRGLAEYGYSDVDVTELSLAQLAHINHLVTSGKGVGTIRGQIGAILGDSLIRGLFK